jgi:SHS2 domain-containing protein
MLAGSEVLQHTSDLELKLHAPTWPELLAEAGTALSARLWGGKVPAPHSGGTWRRVELRAADRAALLVDWLNELLYRAEAEWWVPVEFDVEQASNHEVRARVRGVSVATSPAAVKAATLYGVRVGPGPAGLEATVVLDV